MSPRRPVVERTSSRAEPHVKHAIRTLFARGRSSKPKRRIILRKSSRPLCLSSRFSLTRRLMQLGLDFCRRNRDSRKRRGHAFLISHATLDVQLPRRGSISECEHGGFLIATEEPDELSLSLFLSLARLQFYRDFLPARALFDRALSACSWWKLIQSIHRALVVCRGGDLRLSRFPRVPSFEE